MTIFRRTYAATIVASGGATLPTPVALSVLGGSVTLDEGQAPFLQVNLTITRPSPTVQALLETAAKPRIKLTLTSTPGSTVTLSPTTGLLVTDRSMDGTSREMTLLAVSDEQLLQDYKPSTMVDYKASQASVLSIVNAVLTKAYGAARTATFASGADVTIPTFTAVQNLIPVGSFEAPSGTWASVNVSTAQSTTYRQVGAYSLALTPNASSNESYVALDNPGLTAGATYTMSGYVFGTAGSTPAANARRIVITKIVNGAESILATSSAGVSGTATRVSVTFTVPTTATNAKIRLYNGNSTGNPVVYWDALLLTQGDGTDTNGTPLTYFDGATTSAAYSYAWDGDANLSTSRRTPIVQRDPGVLQWQPGTSAWDFLTPILQASGLRIWHDENGSWRLADNGYIVPGQTKIAAGFNLYSVTEVMGRNVQQDDDLPLYADAVYLNYAWTDGFGVARTALDIAGPASPTKPYVLDLVDTPYPGAGRAAYLLARLSVRQRQVRAVGTMDFAARPGMDCSITNTDGATQTGYVDAITWDLSSRTMTVQSKGLVGVQPNSVGRAPATQTVGSVSTTVAAYTN